MCSSDESSYWLCINILLLPLNKKIWDCDFSPDGSKFVSVSSEIIIWEKQKPTILNLFSKFKKLIVINKATKNKSIINC